jgi:copper chaperone
MMSRPTVNPPFTFTEPLMHEFQLPSMTCGHCAAKVNRALKQVDPACAVEVDMALRKVAVRSDDDRATLAEALSEAGYRPA